MMIDRLIIDAWGLDARHQQAREQRSMSVYRVIELVGTSEVSWDDAAKKAVETASKSLRELRIGEVTKLDLKIEDGKLIYRARLNLSFKYEGSK
jgi:dodecin